ncbi:Uncharacterised protein [Mycobacteroides abscessus]|nr:Uncharacterised protein [Mycobacteroides abscessus]
MLSSTRTTPESSGCASAVLPWTNRSYWFVTHSLDARFGDARRRSAVARSSSPLSGRASASASTVRALSPSCHAGRAYGRWYTGPSCATVRGSTSTMRSPWWSIVRRPESLTSPMTAVSTSHLAVMARNSSSFSGATTAIMRSCDSDMRISPALSVGSRSRTSSSHTCMPPSPFEASSDVAHEIPAAPRSWMPSTTCAA